MDCGRSLPPPDAVTGNLKKASAFSGGGRVDRLSTADGERFPEPMPRAAWSHAARAAFDAVLTNPDSAPGGLMP